jgi:hypothetical protein
MKRKFQNDALYNEKETIYKIVINMNHNNNPPNKSVRQAIVIKLNLSPYFFPNPIHPAQIHFF